MSRNTLIKFTWFYAVNSVRSLIFVCIFMMGDRLVEINRKELPFLKKLYIKNKQTFALIDIYIRCFEIDPNVEHIQFYSLNGDFSRGTFAVIVSVICEYWQ